MSTLPAETLGTLNKARKLLAGINRDMWLVAEYCSQAQDHGATYSAIGEYVGRSENLVAYWCQTFRDRGADDPRMEFTVALHATKPKAYDKMRQGLSQVKSFSKKHPALVVKGILAGPNAQKIADGLAKAGVVGRASTKKAA